MTPEQFWDASPREIYRAFEADRLRRRDEHDRDVAHAWATVAIYFHAKGKRRLPPIDSMLLAKRPRRVLPSRQARADMLAFAEKHNAAVAKRQKVKGPNKVKRDGR